MTARHRTTASLLHRALRVEAGFTLAELLVAVLILGMIMAAAIATLDVSQKSYTRASNAEDVQASMRAAMDRIQTDFREIGSFYAGSGNAGSPVTTFSVTSSGCSSAPPATCTACTACIAFWGDVNADTTSVTMSGSTATVAEATLASAVSSGATSLTVTPAVPGNPGTTGFTNREMVYIGNGSVREVATISSAPSSGNTISVSSLMNGYPAGSLLRSVESVWYTYTPNTSGNLGTLTRYTLVSGNEDLLKDNVVSFSMTAYDFAGTPTTILDAIEEIQLDITAQSTGPSMGDANRRSMTLYVRLRVVPTS